LGQSGFNLTHCAPSSKACSYRSSEARQADLFEKNTWSVGSWAMASVKCLMASS